MQPQLTLSMIQAGGRDATHALGGLDCYSKYGPEDLGSIPIYHQLTFLQDAELLTLIIEDICPAEMKGLDSSRRRMLKSNR